MAKFAQTARGANASAFAENHEGHIAYAMPQKERLVNAVLTSFVAVSKFYGDNTRQIVADCRKVVKVDPRFIGKLALYARTVFHMRSVAHLLVAELSNAVRGTTWVKQVIRDVCLRPDDMVEIAAYYMATFGRKLPKAMQAGLALAFTRFNAYQLAKYNHNGRRPSLVDVLRMAHPAAIDERQNEAFRMLRHDRLPTPKTWETELSARGNSKEVWEGLIGGNNLGYMAMLRNLRNILKAGVSDAAMRPVLTKLTDPAEVSRSRVLPFRFLAAWNSLPEGTGSKVRDALEAAALESLKGMQEIPGRTLVAIDVSGSMSSRISARSEIQCVHAAAMLGIMASQLCDDCVVTAFSGELRELLFSSRSGILSQACALTAQGNTAMHLVFEYAMRRTKVFDRIIVLSDNEVNGNAVMIQQYADRYRGSRNQGLWVHAIDMQGYGTQQFRGDKTNIIAGWSEKALQYIVMREAGVQTFVQAIEAIDLENGCAACADPQED